MSLFNWLLAVHIAAGCVCLITGAVAAGARKKKGLHTKMGEIYHGFFVVIFVTSTLMAILHWAESAYLFYIGVFSYSLALFGYLARKKRWSNWLAKHIGGMLGSYIAIITAVLVVNGPRIPLLKDMPILLLWFLPTIVGSPIIAWVTGKYVPKRKQRSIPK